jgi:sulfite reductase (NADPH) flavoprotein alpha-component
VFHYFGYGSNMSVVALRAKGVEPLASEPAILEGHRLAFDIPDFFPIEGGTGNIARAEGEVVHGVLHACRDEGLALLDSLEALGITYERVEATVTTYAGRQVRAYVYVGKPEILDKAALPSIRYRNILVRGAIEAGLDAKYVESLRALPVLPRPPARAFEVDQEALPRFDHIEPAHVALGGLVFDMSHARPAHAYLRRLLGGRDATLLFLKRMDSSDGTETVDDVLDARLDDEQRRHLHAYLHEFAREYRLVGRLDYAMPAPPSTARVEVAPRTPSRSRIPRANAAVPAREVLLRAEATTAVRGHENEGFLSEARGFMPASPPKTALPAHFAAWDQAAAQLPWLHRSLRLRGALDDLPLLDAGPETLPDDALLRAAAVLAMLSHAYQYVETTPPGHQPIALSRPWAQVRERLGRGPAVLSYVDLIVYNWRLLDPGLPDPMRVENMRLLIPTVDTDEERIFYLTQTEILSHCAPIVSAIVRAQEAAAADDPDALESALVVIIHGLQRVVRESLLKINPNPESPTYVDPVRWAKGVAPFAVPIEPGVQGPSGTSSPIFNALDVFFGRKRYETFLGKEIKELRGTYPPFWREFLAALHAVSVPEYVARKADAHLAGLLHETAEVYAGPNGFLGRHRMKVYGYLELAFKVGRSVTIGGFKGVFKDRTWDEVDGELEASRTERLVDRPPAAQLARVVRVEPAGPSREASPSEGLSTDRVAHVVLDVSGTGLRYEAGDRCAILPENGEELVARTLAALGARGDERVPITKEWREGIRVRPGYEQVEDLSVAEVLRFGRIRPVAPRVAEALHARTQDPVLRDAIWTGTTHRWELWDLLEGLAERGHDPRSFWSGEGARSDAICRLVPPEAPRLYSIASVTGAASTRAAHEIHLTVGRLEYEGRRGTASNFLVDAAARQAMVPISIEHPARFALPRDARTPIVMIAGGTGIAPFRAFLAERARAPEPGPAWLLLGLRDRRHFAWAKEFEPYVRRGILHLHVAFSRDDVTLVPRVVAREGGDEVSWEQVPAAARRVPSLLLEPEVASALRPLLDRREDGGAGASVYVCGRGRFARASLDALRLLLGRTGGGEDHDDEIQTKRRGDRLLRRLIAEGRLMQEVYSGDGNAEARVAIDVSDLARHNDERHGYWIAIDGTVFDLTDYVRLHPGGVHVLRGLAGVDATEAYARAHGGRTEIHAMRDVYAIGTLRRLDLGGRVSLVEGPSGPQAISLAAVHRVWVALLFLVVEMQNALRSDQSLQEGPTSRDEPATPRSPWRLQRAIETHERFLRSYLDPLIAESIPNLWTVTRSVVALGSRTKPTARPSSVTPDTQVPAEDPSGTSASGLDLQPSVGGTGADPALVVGRLDGFRQRPSTAFVEAVAHALGESLRTAIARDDAAALVAVEAACKILEREDRALLASLKETLLEGVRAFEVHEANVEGTAGATLVRACRVLTELLDAYADRLARALGGPGGFHTRVALERRSLTTPPPPYSMKTLISNQHWTMEEDRDNRVVVLRRTGVPFASVAEIVGRNRDVIAKILPEYGEWGVVVDMRYAPARNDPEFENAMRSLRARIGERFARVAVLLESAAGVLQVNRLGRDEGQRTFATMSENAALKFAIGQR